MALQFNPKDYAYLLTEMVKKTQASRFFSDPKAVYFVVQGPKVWMDTFIHFNKRRPKVFLQYGVNPEHSVAVYLSNVNPSGVEFKDFKLNLHAFNGGGLLNADGSPMKKRAGDLISTFTFKAPDVKPDQYSDKDCHFKGADTDIAKYVTKSMED